jgi:hypothetical protein
MARHLSARGDQRADLERGVPGPFYGSPVAVNGRLYNMTRRGDLVVLNAAESLRKLPVFHLVKARMPRLP